MNRASPAGFRLTAALLPLLAAATARGAGGRRVRPHAARLHHRPDASTRPTRIDDQNIIFHMRGSKVYRNHLPRKCPGLERENRIAYETHGSRLCSIDTITVLEDFGVGLRPGFTCRLGEFVPMSAAEVEELELREDGEAGQSSIETSSVEIERDDEAEPTARPTAKTRRRTSAPEPPDAED